MDWSNECMESADIDLLPVPLNNDECNEGKCRKGETNDGESCSFTNRCMITHDSFNDVPMEYRFKKNKNCYDTRTLINVFETNLNIYNYNPSPKYPSDPFIGADYTYPELSKIVASVKDIPPILKIFMSFGEQFVRDMFNNNKETLLKKYGFTKRSSVIVDRIKQKGYRYISRYNNRLTDVTDRNYGMQGDSVGWVSKKYIQDNRKDIAVWYNINGPIKKSKPILEWTDIRENDIWNNSGANLNDPSRITILNKSHIKIITGPTVRTRELGSTSSRSSRRRLPMTPTQRTDCYRKVSNYSKKFIQKGKMTFDSNNFDKEIFNKMTEVMSPKLKAMLSKINELDKEDMRRDGKKYKHFIYSGFTSIGSKLIGSFLVANGLDVVYEVSGTTRRTLKYKEKKSDDRFGLLTSNGLFDLSVSKTLTKQIIKQFNERPKNINGDYMRFIVADMGFQEGVDLFDVKYVHIFEEQKTQKQYNQAIGRAIRRCGTVGLNFVPNKGWSIEIFNYKSQLDTGESLFETALSFDNLNKSVINMHDDLEKTLVTSSIDYFLNNFPRGNINSNLPEPDLNMDILSYQKAIESKYSQYKISARGTITNGCSTPQKGPKIMTLSKPQNFMKDFFTPESPQKGIILQTNIGGGKTCTAISLASNNWKNKTILWVTKTTLTESFWKNAVENVCEVNVAKKFDKLKTLKNPKRILTNSEWIKPLSYRQFTNVLKSIHNNKPNDIAQILIKRNGSSDPLKDTLIIVDEAHQLYEMESPRQKPEMSIFEKSVDASYSKSGKKSVKLLLLTATPLFGINVENQEKFFKLLNLMKINKLPTGIQDIRASFFDNDGNFTSNGMKKFRNEIKGLISYLDISNDPTQFAQPKFMDITVPISVPPEPCASIRRTLLQVCKDLKTNSTCMTDFKNQTDECNQIDKFPDKKSKKECKDTAKVTKNNCKSDLKGSFDSCKLDATTQATACTTLKRSLKGVVYQSNALEKCK